MIMMRMVILITTLADTGYGMNFMADVVQDNAAVVKQIREALQNRMDSYRGL